MIRVEAESAVDLVEPSNKTTSSLIVLSSVWIEGSNLSVAPQENDLGTFMMPVPSHSKNAKAGPGPSTRKFKTKKKELPNRNRTRRNEDAALLKELEDAVNSFVSSY